MEPAKRLAAREKLALTVQLISIFRVIKMGETKTW